MGLGDGRKNLETPPEEVSLLGLVAARAQQVAVHCRRLVAVAAVAQATCKRLPGTH